jgi:hypothetical protein
MNRKEEKRILIIKSLIGISKTIDFKYKKQKDEIFLQIPFLAVQFQRIKA